MMSPRRSLAALGCKNYRFALGDDHALNVVSPWCGDTKVPRLEYALELMFCMPSQHHAIGLQTGCMVTVLAPVVEAARLPRVCPMALGYGLPPCNINRIVV